MEKKKKEVCPTCGKSFVYLNRHKCKAIKPERIFNIACTPPKYDDIGAVLKEMGYAYDEFKGEDLNNANKLKELEILFMNCGGTPDPNAKSKKNIKNFVASGGALYVSDWANKWIQALFPNIMKFHSSGSATTVNSRVVDFDLSEFLGTSEIDLKFDLGSWHGIKEIIKKDTVREYLRGDREVDSQEPLLVTFRFEEGLVIFTAFHNEKQVSELEHRLLEFLVIKPLMHKVDEQSKEILNKKQYKSKKGIVDALEIGEDSQLYKFKVREACDLEFIFNWKGEASAQVSIIDPDDETVCDESFNQIPFEFGVSQAKLGVWNFKIKFNKVPLKRFPFTINVGIKITI